MHKLAILAFCVFLAVLAFPATKKKSRKGTTKKAPASTVAKKSTAKRAAAKKPGGTTTVRSKSSRKSTARKSTAKKSVSKKSSSKKSRSWRTQSQRTPTAERYKEIQEALITRNHLPGPASGEWGPESVAALKRFQQEQNLPPNGKIDALSLKALGLGPKRDHPGTIGLPPNAPATSSAPSVTTNPKEQQPHDDRSP